MRYHGGKARASKRIAPYLIDVATENGCHTYLEPFVGAASVLSLVAPHFEVTYAGDVMPDIILMWQAAIEGWRPPDVITEEEWASLRHAEPSALRAVAGFGCSFGGKFFQGYGRNKQNPDKNPAGAVVRDLDRRAPILSDTTFRHTSFDTWSPSTGWLVYCDPPYLDTTGYQWAGKFDHDHFYDVVEQWTANGATVIVSEESAPPHWELIAEWQQPATLSRVKSGDARSERLYVARNETAKAFA